METVDAAIVGAGTAGLAAAAGMAQCGLSIALAEQDRVDGDYPNRGCATSRSGGGADGPAGQNVL